MFELVTVGEGLGITKSLGSALPRCWLKNAIRSALRLALAGAIYYAAITDNN